MMNEIEKAFRILGGEGSRGGLIVGYTLTKKPIYLSSSKKAHKEEHQNFTARDHQDAARQFRELGRTKGVMYADQEDWHKKAAEEKS
jgi:hypothetical protein